MSHISQLRSQFFLKRLNRYRLSNPHRGKLYLSYVFVDSSEEFEHVQSPTEELVPGQTLPTLTNGGGAGEEEEEEGEGEREEETELPPDWEQRTVSNTLPTVFIILYILLLANVQCVYTHIVLHVHI